MRLLLDECVDRRLAGEIRGHEVSTVSELGWAGIRNGELLIRASGKFDVFVTVDRNLALQQRVVDLPLPVVILRARSNRVIDLRPLVAALLERLPNIKPGEVVWIES